VIVLFARKGPDGSLEKALTETRHKLEQEQTLRRQAEQLQDEAEARRREAEGALVALKEDCDAAHEELAFKESELEETRLELEVEQENIIGSNWKICNWIWKRKWSDCRSKIIRTRRTDMTQPMALISQRDLLQPLSTTMVS
jgi:hypothetical protein